MFARRPPRRPLSPNRSTASFLALALVTLLSGCSSMEFQRLSETHGEFYGNGVAITIFSIDLPKRAIDIARENLSDARQPNMRIEEELVFPYFGPLDWILDIFSVRFASISGTWGFPPESAKAESAR
jgi:hypothetical protein